MIRKMELKPLPPEKWDKSLDNILEDMKGAPLNVHSLMAHHPNLLSAWWNFRKYSVTGGALGKRKGEIVILRSAHHLQAWYEWGAHVERGLASGLKLTEIEELRRPVSSNNFEKAEKVLIKAVDELYVDKSLSSACLSGLYEYYSTQQVMDIMAIQGMYIILGCLIKTWGLELEATVLEKLPASVTKENFLNQN